jgi:hypothetical protein
VSRLEQDNRFVIKMANLDLDKYTVDEAWNDLIDLY